MPTCTPPNYPGSPSYAPEFIASSVSCTMDKHQELRGRCPVGLGGTFFRTKDTGVAQNDLSIEMQGGGGGASRFTLLVRDGSGTVETFAYSGQGTDPGDGICPNNLIPLFRADVNTNSDYIEMPTVDYGGASIDSGELPIFEAVTDDAGCLSAFVRTYFAGGTGAPSSGPSEIGGETQPRTGPERTMYVIILTEIVNNDASDLGQSHSPVPPAENKVMQWDGFAWVQYQPNVCL